MIVASAPLRVSFAGGGTDFPSFYRMQGGAVIGGAIDKKILIAANPLPRILDYRYRVCYSSVEECNDVAAIEHPVVRAVLQHRGYDSPLELSVQSDLPARSGLGSSSTFTVCMLALVDHLTGATPDQTRLAEEAVYIERDLLAEAGGVQDQYFAALGGLRRFDFSAEGIVSTAINSAGAALLNRSMYLVYTGSKRFSATIQEKHQEIINQKSRHEELSALGGLVDEFHGVMDKANDGAETGFLTTLGDLLNEGWRRKQLVNSATSSSNLNDLYQKSLSAGALGGKLCGAGAGGFFLFIVPDSNRQDFIETMGRDRVFNAQFDFKGVQTLEI